MVLIAIILIIPLGLSLCRKPRYGNKDWSAEQLARCPDMHHVAVTSDVRLTWTVPIRVEPPESMSAKILEWEGLSTWLKPVRVTMNYIKIIISKTGSQSWRLVLSSAWNRGDDILLTMCIFISHISMTVSFWESIWNWRLNRFSSF